MKPDCHKSFVGRYWIAMVGGILRCSHLHRTPAAARRCASDWIRFQKKVDKFKTKAQLKT